MPVLDDRPLAGVFQFILNALTRAPLVRFLRALYMAPNARLCSLTRLPVVAL